MKKSLLALSIVLVMSILFTGCGSKSVDSTAEKWDISPDGKKYFLFAQKCKVP